MDMVGFKCENDGRDTTEVYMKLQKDRKALFHFNIVRKTLEGWTEHKGAKAPKKRTRICNITGWSVKEFKSFVSFSDV